MTSRMNVLIITTRTILAHSDRYIKVEENWYNPTIQNIKASVVRYLDRAKVDERMRSISATSACMLQAYRCGELMYVQCTNPSSKKLRDDMARRHAL